MTGQIAVSNVWYLYAICCFSVPIIHFFCWYTAVYLYFIPVPLITFILIPAADYFFSRTTTSKKANNDTAKNTDHSKSNREQDVMYRLPLHIYGILYTLIMIHSLINSSTLWTNKYYGLFLLQIFSLGTLSTGPTS